MKEVERLQEYINESQYIVFFGGAGVSTESGIKDFRSQDGLYHMTYPYPPERILSHSFWKKNPREFYKFYRDKMNALPYPPNSTHIYLKNLEDSGKLKFIITQNIDGLHNKAGSRNVLELHGSIYQNHCVNCHKAYSPDKIFKEEEIPICTCGGLIKPDVVLCEEALDESIWEEALYQIQRADLLLVAGTSLSVYPASSLLSYFHGKHLVLLNKETTLLDHKADLVIHDSLGNIFSKLK